MRPGLEALRDLAAQGEIQTVLVYSPDRLSRKYAYQLLLAEECSGAEYHWFSCRRLRARPRKIVCWCSFRA